MPENELQYTVTDKNGTKYLFDRWHYLRRTIDANGNMVSYNYGPNSEGNVLGSILDAVNHKITLNYDDGQKKLTSIEDEIGREITYSYDGSDNLTEITYPDGTKTTFSYDGHKLNKVTSPDGYSVCYEYTDDMRVPRISKIEEKSGEETGQSMEISYKNGNTTVFEDCGLDGDLSTQSDNITMTYHFDDMAVPRCVQIRMETPTITIIIPHITGMMMLTTIVCAPRERPRQRSVNYIDNPGIDDVGGDAMVCFRLGWQQLLWGNPKGRYWISWEHFH